MVHTLEEVVKKAESLPPKEQEIIARQIEGLLEDLEDTEFYEATKKEPRLDFEEVAAEFVQEGKLPADWRTK